MTWKLGQKVEISPSRERGEVVGIGHRTVALRLDNGQRVIVSHTVVRRCRRRGAVPIVVGTPEELRLATGLGLTIQQVRNARR